MKNENADFFTIGSARNFCWILRLIKGDAHIPFETKCLDAENIFFLFDEKIRHGQNILRPRENLLAAHGIDVVRTGVGDRAVLEEMVRQEL